MRLPSPCEFRKTTCIYADKHMYRCRTCTSSAAWMAMMRSSTASKSSVSSQQPHTSSPTPSSSESDLQPGTDCPPDVEELGRSSWMLLHSMTASYPEQPDTVRQRKTHTFLSLFSQLYPCWVCAEDFQSWMAEPENDVAEALKSQEAFGQWMCRAHNAVNVKLGKDEFDCKFWRERWKDGWKDGRCD